MKLCQVTGCERRSIARDMCGLHWERWRKGIPLKLPLNYRILYKYGWVSHGYRWVSTEDGEITLHRYLMQKHLGRKLHTDEVVHHVNGDKLDNRIENLRIMPRDLHTAEHRAHQPNCFVCGSDDKGGGSGLCGIHRQEVHRFLKRHDIAPPANKGGKITLLVGVALALHNDRLGKALEMLQAREK